MDQLQQKIDKAKAFDVLTKVFDIKLGGTIMGLPRIEISNDNVDYECNYCESKDISQEEYEILKKAGI